MRNNNTEDSLIKNMIFILFVYTTLVQLLLIASPGDLLRESIGLWVGAITGSAMLIHIKKSALEMLELGEIGAKKYAKKQAILRMTLVAIVFGLVFYYDLGSVLTVFIGVMGLKVAAYLQPIFNRYKESK